MTDMSYEIKEQSELEKLMEENARLRSALEFYANQDNWGLSFEDFNHEMRMKINLKDGDTWGLESAKAHKSVYLTIGGKTAREALWKGSSE